MEAFRGFEFPRGSGRVWEYPRTRRLLMDWNSNLITNQGLDHIGQDSGNPIQYCHVGTGNTAPANTDTSLVGELATKQYSNRTPSAQSTPPYFGRTEANYLFQPNFGGGAVNIQELGISPDGQPTALGARSLTVDGVGSPSSISVLATEYLEVYYRRRNYPAHVTEATGAPTDDTGTVTIEGVDYDYTIRPIFVTYGGSYNVSTSAGWGVFAMRTMGTTVGFNSQVTFHAYGMKSDMTLGAITGGPGGTVQGGAAGTQDEGRSSYTAASYSRELWYQWGISQLNDAGGIGGLVLKTNYGAYQLVFDTPVPKVYGQVFTFYHNFSWARKNTWV